MINEQTLPGSRIDVADVLRGFAVMAIMLLHCIEHFNFYSFPDTSEQGNFLNFTDKAIWDSLFFAFGGKAYAIFAFLFGFSFFIQDNNQLKKGYDFRLRFMWRLVLLFLIGNLNAMFFTAEVLVLYALVGFVLVVVCRFSNKVVLGLAILCLLQPVEWWKVFSALSDPAYEPAKDLTRQYFAAAKEVQTNGNFWEMSRVNLWEGQLASLYWAWAHGRFFQTAALFMFGMLIGRTGLFADSEKNRKNWLIILGWALVCFFPLNGLKGMLSGFVENKYALRSLGLICQSLANFAFMLILVSGVILTFYLTRMQSLWRKLIPYGKMSLTNYVTQSIIGAMIFYNWGFGLHKYLGITYSFLLGIVLFLIQWSFCNWWMKHHRQGPLEYVWKKATWIGKKN